MSYIFPKNLVVGFNKRSEGLLGFLTYIDPIKKDVRSKTSWLKWKNDSIPEQVIENKPMTGFVINKNVRRDTHFGGNEYVRVWHPQGFEFEISTSVFEHLIGFVDMSKGEIMTECVLGWEGQKVELVAVNDPAFVGVTDNPKFSSKSEDHVITVFEHGHLYDFKGERVVYLGLGAINTNDNIYFSNSMSYDQKYPYFYNVDKKEVCQLKTRIKYVKLTDKELSNEEQQTVNDFIKNAFICMDVDKNHKPIQFGMCTNREKWCIEATYSKITSHMWGHNPRDYPLTLDEIEDNTIIAVISKQFSRRIGRYDTFNIYVKHKNIWYAIDHNRQVSLCPNIEAMLPDKWVIGYTKPL